MKNDASDLVPGGTPPKYEEGSPPLAPQEGGFVRFWRKLGGGSLMVAIVIHILILVLGAFWVIRTLKEPQKVVDFNPGGGGGGGGEAELKSQHMAQKRANQSSARRVVVEGMATSVAMPDPGDSFGSMASIGSLTGGGGMGGGSGGGKGGGNGTGIGKGRGSGVGDGGFAAGAMFFNQEVKATRVAYVIDYSLSMKGKREELMRAELEKSVRKLVPPMKFQLIFFCGPAWIAGDYVELAFNNLEGKVSHGGTEFNWKATGGGVWEADGKKQKAEWIDVNTESLDKAATNIAKTKLEYGTHWAGPLEMALAMEPPPELIFFMTDGASPGTTDKMIEDLAKKARARRTVINTMSLMEPAADAGMKTLARLAKGKFTIIKPDGTAEDVPVN